MEYQNLGKSGLKVSRLSFGSWLTFGSSVDNSLAEDMMQYSYDQGVNFFDNAEAYAQGQAETIMGKVLQKSNWKRSDLVISTKI